MQKRIKGRNRYRLGPLARMPIAWPRDRELYDKAVREGLRGVLLGDHSVLYVAKDAAYGQRLQGRE